MGFFKSLKKAFKKVTSGIKKVVKKAVRGVKKVVKKIASSKLLKAIAIAAAIYITGGAAISAFSGGTATGWAGAWASGATNIAAGTGLTATGAAAGTWTAAAQTAAGYLATPFAAAGTALGTAAAAVTDFTGLTTEAGRTAQTAQQAAITGQTATTATTSLTEDQIIQGLNPAEVAQAGALPSATSVEAQLASSTQTAFNAGSGTTTAGGLNIPTTLPSASYATGAPAQQLAQTVPNALGITPIEAATAETASWAARNPLTSSFLGGAATVAKMTGSAILSGYIGSQFQEDPRVSPSGKDYEGASRFNPLQIYAAEEGIDYGDMDKYFTFNNIGDTSNMPLFQQQTIGIT
tara:strand:+ start:1928 stop:2977 length:1050 start_codon:yes stop_codon:yes gene_type:complete